MEELESGGKTSPTRKRSKPGVGQNCASRVSSGLLPEISAFLISPFQVPGISQSHFVPNSLPILSGACDEERIGILLVI